MELNYRVADRTGRWILLTTVLASSMAFIDGSALNVALSELQIDLGASGAELLWIVNSYLLFLAALILLGGALGDRYGRKRVFGYGIGLFALASLAAGLAPGTTWLIAARAVQGVGGAMMVPGSLAIIAASFSPSDSGKAIGIWSSASTVTTIGGPILGGVLAGAGLWRAVFFINLPLAAIALYSLRHVPESRDENAPERLDYPGAALAVLGLIGLTYGLITLGDRGLENARDDAGVLISLIAGVLALIVFVIVERRSTHPMLRLSLFQSRTFTGANAMTAFLYGALGGAIFFLPLNLIQVQGYDASVAGLTMLPFSLLLAGLSPLAGAFADRYGPRVPLTLGPAITGIGFLLLILPGVTGGPHDYWTTYLPGILGIGLGMGITVAPLSNTVMTAVSSSQAGTASGINNAVSRLAQVLATAALGALALGAFSSGLETRTAQIDLPAQARETLLAHTSDLANTEPPPGLAPETQQAVEGAIQDAFVEAFRWVFGVAVALAWLSALCAATLIEPGRLRSQSEPQSARLGAGDD
ncbi:DHA2 family efflux MFS transporter permease subunit [Aggregatilinea lenta]|uniref:DHA2 family efflux MFS transporter permease subunit n=1 Tax=Aggregatilinea lenta TaxID=913108 RepID=UPI000E5BEA3A|nr:DHA2 family efflux MFS transporter permease subunit [Aggregatilinea lenta]